MISRQPGNSISASEVTNIEPLGFWVLVDGREYFVPFADYPVFQAASIQQIFQMERLSPRQLHWPELDADIEIDALETPEHYTLIFR
jgi:hypothetical protein